MGKKKKRRRFTTEQKARILREHLFEKKPISEVSEEHDIQPSVLYDWQNRANVNLGQALEGPRSGRSSRERRLEARVAALEAQVDKKNAVIVELLEEHVTLKKSLGEP